MTKGNCKPITVLSANSKVYERWISEQVVVYSESLLFQHLRGFRKGFNTQRALVKYLEKYKSVLDKKGFAGVILMDLSQAYNCLNH